VKPQAATEKAMREWYTVFNNQYFKNKLPPSLPIKFHRLKNQLGVTLFIDDHPLCINLDSRLKTGDFSRTIMTLLHEMCHVAIYRGHKEHGPKFQSRMLKLAQQGAFADWW
jgi:hypothetical protein